ncbi:AAA family ATPase [Streptomyces sp. ST2-7A]|uniref:helix-turn-helix transcriptional regulator n=1 Tax=Streptomyces sp. ST2-7A TaxID=2907214 RepID=UPI001F1FBA95|nr:AAA family ATPase [Streptomyces sp. ST2-7A]MCE7082038.1 AAA family ATPase [Streptomyces sp. ST2-7A]
MRSRAPNIVGRDHHLARLEQSLADARRQRGGVIFLTGEAGIGKSRLAAEAAGMAFDSGMRVLRGRSSTTGPTIPFRPLTEALMSLFRGGEPMDDLPLGPYRPVLGQLIPEWGNEIREAGSMVVLGEAVLRLLIATGRERGQLLLLEDLHDADPETLAVVEYLVDNLDFSPAVLLATIRTEPCDALDMALAAQQRGSGTLMELLPLRRDEARDMIAAQLGTDPGKVPEVALDRLWDDSAGSPFIIEELLQGMISGGALVRGEDGWRVVGDPRSDVSNTLARGILRRIDRLGPQGLTLLSVAAVFGRRFPLSVLQHMIGMDDHALLTHLHAGVAAQLVVPDEPAPDWYAFRHPLTVEALFTQLTPGNRADLARQAADAVHTLHPDLDGDWCPLVAELRSASGESVEAGRLFAEAGLRALRGGMVGSAVTLLGRAEELLADTPEITRRAETLEALLPALAETGEFTRAFELAEQLHALGGAGLTARRLAVLHTRLAGVAHVAGRWADGNRQIERARAALNGTASERDTASIEVTAAYLTLDTPGAARTQLAEELARSGLEAAERHELPMVACQALELLATLARERDVEEATGLLERARYIAEKHRLPLQRMYVLTRIGGNRWLTEGDTGALLTAREEAQRLGSVTVVHTIDGILTLDAVLRAEFEEAERSGDTQLPVVQRLRLAPAARYLLLARATLAGHRGDRATMESTLETFTDWGGTGSQEEPLTLGLARAFCSLLEEDRSRAVRELRAVSALERENPSTYYLSGHYGIGVLLDVLSRDADRAAHRKIAATAPGRLRWNRQFLELARAVLLGREGRGEEAGTVAAGALRLAEPYPTALHLGLRLVAPAAHEDGWGDPVSWLRRAEHHFHRTEVPDVTNACRAELRRLGAPVHQHRTGTSGIPEELRALGVTVREYEVFRLLPDRPGNKDIADRLHISPRTVEKHIASLITKTGRPNRSALCDLSASL